LPRNSPIMARAMAVQMESPSGRRWDVMAMRWLERSF